MSTSSSILRYNPRKEGLERWLGSLETTIMDIIWDRGAPCTVKYVFRTLADDRAYTTIMTTMQRLAEKGILTRKRVGLSYQYTPVDADQWVFIVRQEIAVAESLISIEYQVRK